MVLLRFPAGFRAVYVRGGVNRPIFFLLLLLLPVFSWAADSLKNCTQLIVGQAENWDASSGSLWLCERDAAGKPWRVVTAPVPVLFGKNGLAWGRGVIGTDEPGRSKVEKDKRAPAGIFEIGKIYGYDPVLPDGASFPFHQVGKGDAWIDDPTLPEYNRHVVVEASNPPPWFEKQKMRHGDFAYRWLVEIRHNSGPIIPGAGSAIFFHIRRGPSKPSAGCTTMAEADLLKLIRWLRKERHPHYALLPQSEYLARWKGLGLPAQDHLR